MHSNGGATSSLSTFTTTTWREHESLVGVFSDGHWFLSIVVSAADEQRRSGTYKMLGGLNGQRAYWRKVLTGC